MKILLKNGSVVTPTRVYDYCDVLIEDEKIVCIRQGIKDELADEVIDL